jgi:uncharacterized protein (DUF58 family)
MVYKELRPRGGAAGAGALALATWSVWSTTGSRLSLFLCAASVALLVIDLVWSQVATARARVEVTANPQEALVGDRITLRLSVTGPRQFLRLRLVSFRPEHGELGVDVPAMGELQGTALAREVTTEVVLEVVSNGLAGLVGCARRQPVPLRRPLAVGPRPIPADQPFPDVTRVWGDGEPRPAQSGELVRGVRPYVAGDPLRRVHWRVTARAGDLVVKEVEDTATARLVMVFDLGGGGMAGERAAGRAAWYGSEAVRRGYSVTLATAERGKIVTGPVRSRSELNWRLAAAALPGHPQVPSLRSGTQPALRSGTQPALRSGTQTGTTSDPVLVVTDRGDSWH